MRGVEEINWLNLVQAFDKSKIERDFNFSHINNARQLLHLICRPRYDTPTTKARAE
jgi:hypothetical protein